MFRDVRLHSRHHSLRVGVLTHKLRYLGVLHRVHVHLNMCFMVLVDKRLDWLAVDDVHVLRHRVTRLHVVTVLERYELLGVLDPKHFKHLAMQVWHIIKLRCTLRELQNCLILHDLLCHRRSVRVADRDDRDHVIVRFLGLAAAFFWLVAIRFWRIIRDDNFEELELLLHRIVDACLNSRHGLERALKDRQRGTDRGLARHVRDLQISRRGEATAFLYDGTQKRVQDL